VSGAECHHGPDECPDGCMCPCDLCYLLRTEAYTGDAMDLLVEALAHAEPEAGPEPGG
jgi:hypothetical protein